MSARSNSLDLSTDYWCTCHANATEDRPMICQNQGTCIHDPGSKKYSCNCGEEYKGDFCQTKVEDGGEEEGGSSAGVIFASVVVFAGVGVGAFGVINNIQAAEAAKSTAKKGAQGRGKSNTAGNRSSPKKPPQKGSPQKGSPQKRPPQKKGGGGPQKGGNKKTKAPGGGDTGNKVRRRKK